MPPIRSSSRMSRLPSLRICQPRRSSARRSAQAVVPRRGGTRENRGTRAAAKRRMREVYAEYACASSGDRPVADRPVSDRPRADEFRPASCGPKARRAPPGNSAALAMPCAAHCSPWDSRRNSRSKSAGIRCSRCAPADTRKPGANSRVRAAPPTWLAASSTSTERPPRANVAAQTSPLWPPPMTMQS